MTDVQVYIHMWALNSEPLASSGDPRTQLDVEPTYLWNTHSKDEWLYFDGDAVEVRR